MFYSFHCVRAAHPSRDRLAVAVLMLLSMIGLGGCQTAGQSGALGGAGLGALVGALAGGSTESALIGAGIGTGLGYIIGNERDKKQARELAARPVYVPPANPLAGTSWQVLSVNPMPTPGFRSMTVTFQHGGFVNSTKILDDGRILEEIESYRVNENTLIVNRPGYLINVTFIMSGNRLTLQGSKLSAVLQRVGS